MKQLLMVAALFLSFSQLTLAGDGSYNLDDPSLELPMQVEADYTRLAELSYCNIAITDVVVKLQAHDDKASSAEYSAMDTDSEKAQVFKTNYSSRMNAYGNLVEEVSACPERT